VPEAAIAGVTVYRIYIDTDPRTVIEEILKVIRDPTTTIYTDASIKDGNLGAAVVILDTNNAIYRARQITVGPDWKWNGLSTELIAIYYK
jgi:hypothetical protein